MAALATALAPLLVLLAWSLVACAVGYGLVSAFPGLPLNQLISKTTLLLLLATCVPAARYWRLDRRALGLAAPKRWFGQFWLGFGLGLGLLLPVLLALLALGVQVVDTGRAWTASALAGQLLVALLLALLISALEEPLFRGVLLAGLANKLAWPLAVAVSAAYYAALHFLTNKAQIPAELLDWRAALDLLAGAYLNLAEPSIRPAMLALFMVGLVLGALRMDGKTNLVCCVGCHTAWVWLIKTSKGLFNLNAGSPHVWLVSGYDGIVGPLVAAWLGLALVLWGCWRWRARRPG